MQSQKPQTGPKLVGPYPVRFEDAGPQAVACLRAAKHAGVVDPVAIIFHVGYAAASALFNVGVGPGRATSALADAERSGRLPLLLIAVPRDAATALLALRFPGTAVEVARGDPCFVVVDDGALAVRFASGNLVR
ncbi:MAG TPA: hypothetical protein VGH33_19425 [Isosphaeraceae bacterium]|jgi:hypothetical protein